MEEIHGHLGGVTECRALPGGGLGLDRSFGQWADVCGARGFGWWSG